MGRRGQPRALVLDALSAILASDRYASWEGLVLVRELAYTQFELKKSG